jgi:hypothetical protein
MSETMPIGNGINDAVWRYIYIPDFLLMTFVGLFFVSKFGYISPIEKRLVGTYPG